MKKLDDPDNFAEGDSREELVALGEGQVVTVVAYSEPAGAWGRVLQLWPSHS